MTAVLALNAVLAIVVVAALLRLLSWAIVSSHRDELPVRIDVREPARRPYAPRPHSPHPHSPHPHWPSGHLAQQRFNVPASD